MAEFKPFEEFATDAIHVGQDPEQWRCGAVVPLISLSSVFQQDGPGVTNPLGYDYARSGNPTRTVAETCVAALEKAKHGLLFSSGLAAVTCITQLLDSGDHVVVMDDCYGGIYRFFKTVANRGGIESSFVDATNEDNVRAAIKENTRMVWIETPTNPNMKIVDIRAVSKVVKESENVFLAVDNTFASCYFQRPLDLGSDITFQSVTKYLNGHSDVVMGAVVTNDDVIAKRLRYLQNATGPVPSAFDCYLLNRGLKTLHLRMQQHQKNGLEIARYLKSNPRVQKVMHPGLESHPQFERAKSQMIGHSGMVTFNVRGDLEETKVFFRSTKLFKRCVSLGSYMSLMEHPATMTHAAVIKEERELHGIHDNMIRLSCGLEDAEDLIQDLEQALVKAIPVV